MAFVMLNFINCYISVMNILFPGTDFRKLKIIAKTSV